MAIIEPVKKDPANPDLLKRKSAALRLWHWSNAIIISGSLITVLINSTVLNNRGNQSFLKTELQKGGTSLTNQQAGSLAHAQSDEVWGVHVYFGYFLAAFFVFRLILEFFQPQGQRFFAGLKEAYNHYFNLKQNRYLAGHELAVKVIYMLFYLLLTIMVVTGLSLAFGDQLSFLKPIRHSIKSVHGFCMYFVLAYIVVHIAGVILAERGKEPGVVSNMINGGKADQE